MSRAAHIYLDAPAREDSVTFAVIPIDSVTGAIVRSGVTARITDRPDRALLNRSGMLVFINLTGPPPYQVEVDATEAGFFGPETIVYPPPGPVDPNPDINRRLEVLLEPRPDYPFPAATTLVRGVVVRGAAPETGAEIACSPQGSTGDYRARSTDRGAFALALRLPPPPDFDTHKKIEVEIRLSSGPTLPRLTRRLTCELTSGRTHSFSEPVDLAGIKTPNFF